MRAHSLLFIILLPLQLFSTQLGGERMDLPNSKAGIRRQRSMAALRSSRTFHASGDMLHSRRVRAGCYALISDGQAGKGTSGSGHESWACPHRSSVVRASFLLKELAAVRDGHPRHHHPQEVVVVAGHGLPEELVHLLAGHARLAESAACRAYDVEASAPVVASSRTASRCLAPKTARLAGGDDTSSRNRPIQAAGRTGQPLSRLLGRARRQAMPGSGQARSSHLGL